MARYLYEGSHANEWIMPSSPSPQPTFRPQWRSGASLLDLSVELLQCIVDYLDRDGVCALKQTCKGLSRSQVIEEAMYRRPIRYHDLNDQRISDWGYGPDGRLRWENFKKSIHDGNRNYVKRMAMSHFSTLDDFRWVEANLPRLIGLDLSDVRDFLWSVETTIVSYPALWTWSDLAEACPKLFARLRYLMLFNWADYRSHMRVQYRYPIHEHAYTSLFRKCRRRGQNGNAANTILKACTGLETLAIRGTLHSCRYWSPWDVHQQVCLLTSGISNNISKDLKLLKIHQTTPYLTVLFDQLSKALPAERTLNISVGFEKWVKEDRREGGTYQTRLMTPNFRDENNSFDPASFDTCECNHLDTAQQLVNESCDTLGQILSHMAQVFKHKDRFNLKSYDHLRHTVINPFQFINPFAQSRTRPENPNVLYGDTCVEVLKWMRDSLAWLPTFTWDPLMFDTFPANITSDLRISHPKNNIIEQVTEMLRGFKSLDLPIRLVMGDRTDYYIHAFGQQRHLFFGPTKTLEGEGLEKREVIKECNSRFNISYIVDIVDELVIEYSCDTPGIFDRRYERNRVLTEHEWQLMCREMAGWRKFWARYAPYLQNLKKLVVMAPKILFDDWAKSKQFQRLVNDESWNIVSDESVYTKPRWVPCEFVKRTFFRLGKNGRAPASLNLKTLGRPKENESRDFDVSELEDAETLEGHAAQFWPWLTQQRFPKKRKAVDYATDHEETDEEGPLHNYTTGQTYSTRTRYRKHVRNTAVPFFTAHFGRLLDGDSGSDSE